MDTNSKQQKRRDEARLSSLNGAVEALNLVKEATSMTPANSLFGRISTILTVVRVNFLLFPVPYPRFTCIQDSVATEIAYADAYQAIEIACAGVYKALDPGTNGKKIDDLSQPVRETIATWNGNQEVPFKSYRDLGQITFYF